MSAIVATGYDAVGANVQHIPSGAKLVFGYVDGPRSAWTNEQWALFNGIIRGSITVTGGEWYKYASIFDCEFEDITPEHLPGLIKARNAFSGKHDATVYCNLDTLPRAVENADKAGEPYWIWIADPTGKPRGGYSLHTGQGRICAQQYDWVNNQYDISAVYSQEWLSTLVHPTVKPAPVPVTRDLTGYVVYTPGTVGGFSGRPVKSVDNGKTWQ